MSARTRLALDDSSAVFSPCDLYRYRLQHIWDARLPLVAFLMLNPSTATAEVSDPTVRRCLGYAQRWGYGGLIVGNAFAYRSTDPKALKLCPDPVGPENDAHLLQIANDAKLIVCGWGRHAALNGRGAYVLNMLRSAGFEPHALKVNDDGSPCHPLYLAGDLVPAPMEVR